MILAPVPPMLELEKRTAQQLGWGCFMALALAACGGLDGLGDGGSDDGDAGSGGSGGSSSGGSGNWSGGAASGGLPGAGGSVASGGSFASGGAASGGATATGGATSTGGASAEDRCAAGSLTWKSGNKTNYESYPDPGSQECIEFNGCTWAGQFAGCGSKQTEEWVASHNIAALFPNFGAYELHDICIKSGSKTMVVTVYDTCGDSDCDGCCTENKGNKDALIDLEKSTNERWGLGDGAIQWADLGPTTGDGCD